MTAALTRCTGCGILSTSPCERCAPPEPVFERPTVHTPQSGVSHYAAGPLPKSFRGQTRTRCGHTVTIGFITTSPAICRDCQRIDGEEPANDHEVELCELCEMRAAKDGRHCDRCTSDCEWLAAYDADPVGWDREAV